MPGSDSFVSFVVEVRTPRTTSSDLATEGGVELTAAHGRIVAKV
jgi:hypothetical protein